MASEKQPLMKKIQKWYDDEFSEESGAGSNLLRNRDHDSTMEESGTSSGLFLPDGVMMKFNEGGLEEEDDFVLEEIPQWTRKEIAVTSAAVAASVSASLSLLVAYSSGFLLLVGSGETLLCCIAGALGIAIPTYSAYQEQKITDFRALEKTHEVLSNERVKLKKNSDSLKKKILDMEESTKNLSDVKETLETLKAEKRASLEELETQLKEKELTLKLNEENSANRILDNVFAFIERGDADNDGYYEEDEIRVLIQQVETIHVDLDEKNFVAKLKEDKDGSHDIQDVYDAMAASIRTL